MLRVALPNKGTLATPAGDIFREAGYRQRTDRERSDDGSKDHFADQIVGGKPTFTSCLRNNAHS